MAIRYGKSLYKSNDVYKVHHYKNRGEWLKARSELHGIGGSDASTTMSMNKWRTNLELWQIKTGRATAPDISDKPYVKYGQNAEEYIRRLFQLKFKDKYEIQYQDDTILQNVKCPWMLYSPDGLIVEKDTGRKGIFECKTTTIVRSYDKEKWNKHVPDNYYIQVLHGLNVTGFDFVDLYAELMFDDDYSQLIRYHIERDDVLDDLIAVSSSVTTFWKEYVETGKEPPLIIQGL